MANLELPEIPDADIHVISDEELEAARNNPAAREFLERAFEQERYLEENDLIHP